MFQIDMSVKQGGMFGVQPKAQYSKETADLLKLMMKESKLTNFQQRVIKDSMKGGGALPLRVNPSHSKDGPSYKAKPSAKPSPPKITGLKSKERIDLEIANDDTAPYRPAPPKYNNEKEKERLNDILIFGTDKPEKLPKPKTPVPKPERDRFEEIQDEIREREEFLAEMEALGRGKEFRRQIQTEISQYIREMEVIDKKHDAEIALLRSKVKQREQQYREDS